MFTEYNALVLDISGADATTLTGLNNNKQAVGFFNKGNEVESFRLDHVDPIKGGAIPVTRISVPGSQRTIANKISDDGNIVGSYVDPHGRSHGFLFRNGRYTTIDFPDASGTEALGINNKPNFG